MLFLILLILFFALLYCSKKLSDKDNYACHLTAAGAGIVAIALICDAMYEIYKHVSVSFN
jgi:hypothetical protein